MEPINCCYIEQARKYDDLGKAKHAALAYLAAVKANESLSESDNLNAAVLFLQIQDYGFFTNHGFTPEVQSSAWEVSKSLLNKLILQGGEVASEATFWKLYADFVIKGLPAFETEAKQLLQKSLVPVILLAKWEPCSAYQEIARQLLLRTSPPCSERDRLIRSYLV